MTTCGLVRGVHVSLLGVSLARLAPPGAAQLTPQGPARIELALVPFSAPAPAPPQSRQPLLPVLLQPGRGRLVRQLLVLNRDLAFRGPFAGEAHRDRGLVRPGD